MTLEEIEIERQIIQRLSEAYTSNERRTPALTSSMNKSCGSPLVWSSVSAQFQAGDRC